MKPTKILHRFRIEPGTTFRVRDHETNAGRSESIRKLWQGNSSKDAKEFVKENVEELAELQQLLYASNQFAVLVIFQAMDAGGKDGMIKHVLSGINPQGCEVHSFKRPSDEELQHDFLWRCSTRLPERGKIGVFNRSYYEEVLVVRVHPEWLEKQNITTRPDKTFWQGRYEDINQFERRLTRNGTVILKFFLNVSKQEQKERFLARLEDPEKNWKFRLGDLDARARWADYMEAFEMAITATSTPWAPWFVIPADDKWSARAIVSAIIREELRGLGLKAPEPGPDQRKELAEARRLLETER